MRSPDLRIAVLGAGNIGSAFAFRFARAGRYDVTVIARPGSNRLAQLQRDGAIVTTGGERADVRIADTLDEETPFDLVIVTVLGHQIDSVLPSLVRSRSKCFLFMFNTFEPERLRDAVGAERCSLGMPFIQALIGTDGRLDSTVGAMRQKSMIGERRWVDLFNGVGLPAAIEPDMELWLRCHAPWCVAFESVAAAGMRRGGGAHWSDCMALSSGARECYALIGGLGYRVYPSMKSRVNRSPAAVFAAMLWAMSRSASFRRLLATGVTECRALVDVMVAAAARSKRTVAISKIEAMKPLR